MRRRVFKTPAWWWALPLAVAVMMAALLGVIRVGLPVRGFVVGMTAALVLLPVPHETLHWVVARMQGRKAAIVLWAGLGKNPYCRTEGWETPREFILSAAAPLGGLTVLLAVVGTVAWTFGSGAVVAAVVGALAFHWVSCLGDLHWIVGVVAVRPARVLDTGPELVVWVEN